MTYAEYIAENVDVNVDVDETIKYAEYIAENVDETIKYAEYIAENIIENTDDVELKRKIRIKKINRIINNEKFKERNR